MTDTNDSPLDGLHPTSERGRQLATALRSFSRTAETYMKIVRSALTAAIQGDRRRALSAHVMAGTFLLMLDREDVDIEDIKRTLRKACDDESLVQRAAEGWGVWLQLRPLLHGREASVQIPEWEHDGMMMGFALTEEDRRDLGFKPADTEGTKGTER